jgi:hypothetical protein
MKKSRFTEVQVAYALRQAEAGTPVMDVCRGLGISEAIDLACFIFRFLRRSLNA